MTSLPGIDYDCFVEGVDAIDLVFDVIDEMLFQNKFAQVDALLARVDVNRLSTQVVLAYLTITSVAHALLPNRMSLVMRSRVLLTQRDLDRVDDLLRGLE